MRNRVVITGFSCLTPLGLDHDLYWNNSIEGKYGTKKIEQIDGLPIPEYMSKVVGQIENFDPLTLGLNKEELAYDRAIQFTLIAVNDALNMSEYNFNLKSKVNVHIATAIGNIIQMEELVKKWSVNKEKDILFSDIKNDKKYVDAFQFSNVANVIAEKYDINGECSVIATGCTGGVDAIGYSFNQIRYKNADLVITGSTEAPITPLVVASFSKINATTKSNNIPEKASRPFEKNRDGFVLAEGCGILILESLEHALKRGAPIFGEIVGYGSCSNALHMTDIPADGKDIARSMKLALDDAGISIEKIDYANLHGSSTPQNDYAERNALAMLSPGNYDKIKVTSNKSQIGHALSASNSIEIVSCIKSLQTNIIPPTINLENQDEQCDLNIITKATKCKTINYILKNSSGFSGIHSTIVLKRYL